MWLTLDGEELNNSNVPDGAFGFIYLMEACIDGWNVAYIGKKNFMSVTTKKLTQKEMPTDKRMKTTKKVSKYNFENYFSSNEVLKNAHKEGVKIQRTVLEIAYSKSQLTYLECMYQFKYDVLRNASYLNSNILGKFYRGKL